MTYKIDTNLWDCLLAQALRDEIAKKWAESLQMARSRYTDKSRFEIYWEEEIDQLADFQLQVISQHQARWEGKNIHGTWQ